MYNGWTHFNELKDYDRAEYYASRALRTVEKELGGELRVINDLYSLLSSIYMGIGNAEKGLEYGQKAIQVTASMGRRYSFGDFVGHFNQGSNYLRLEKWTEALPYLLQSKELLDTLVQQESWSQRLSLNASKLQAKLAFCYLGMDRPEEALTEALIGPTYLQNVENPFYFDYHQTYLALAEAHSHLGLSDKALTYFKTVEDIYRNYFGPASMQMAELNRRLAEHYFRHAALQEALAANTKAFQVLGGRLAPDSLGIAAQSSDLWCQGCEPDFFEQRLRLLFALSQVEASPEPYLQACFQTSKPAIQSLDNIRQTILFREGSRQVLFEKFQSIFRKTSLACEVLYQLTGEEQFLVEAFEVFEKSKSNILLQSLVTARAEESMDLPEELLEKERQLSLEIVKQERLAEKSLEQDEGAKKSLEIQTGDLFAAKQQYEQFLRSLSEKYPNYYAARHRVEVAGINDLQAALGPRSLFLSYMIHPEDSLLQLFVTGAQSRQLISIPWDHDLEEKVQNLFQAAQQSSLVQRKKRTEFIQQSHELYLRLIQPVEDQLAEKSRLIIVPEGILSYLSFDLLLPAAEDQSFDKLNFMIRERAISYHYSATIFLESCRNQERGDRTLLAFAPVFKSGAEENQIGSASRALLDTALMSIDRGGWRPLPGTEEEVQKIGQLFPGSATSILLNEAANEQNLKKNLKRSYRFIHIATHSFANREKPQFSGIACAGTSGAEEDDVLYANELYQLDVRADLVVLSSCESGFGQLAAGEGMLGLNRSFIYQGVPNVLYTLWKVNDEKSSQIMLDFYRNLRSGQTYEQALRSAKLALLANPATALPAYWAPFALIGR